MRFNDRILFESFPAVFGVKSNFGFCCRLCCVSIIPVINALSEGQTFTVADKKTGISEDPVCGVLIPLLGKLKLPLGPAN